MAPAANLEDMVENMEASQEQARPLLLVQDVSSDEPSPPATSPPAGSPLIRTRHRAPTGDSSMLESKRTALLWKSERDDHRAETVPSGYAGKVTARHLIEATERGDPDLVRRMIGFGVSVNAPIRCEDSRGDVFVTLLHVLSSRTDLPRGTEVIAEIARGKANLNARSSLGTTPLSRACLYKHVGAAELLLELGADTTPLDDMGRTAVHCAVVLDVRPDAAAFHGLARMEQLSGGLVSLLASKKADLDSGGDAPPLLEAIKQHNRSAVAALVRHGARPRFLHVAVELAPAPIVEDLLKGLANPLEEDAAGRSVLDIAFGRGDEDITTLLRDAIGDHERRHFAVDKVPDRFQVASSTKSPDQDEVEGLGLSVDCQRKRGHEDTPMGKVNSTNSTMRERKSSTHRFVLGDGLRTRSFGGAKLVGDIEPSEFDQRLREHMIWLQHQSRRLSRQRSYQILMLSALIAALFFPDLWTLVDASSNQGLDIEVIIVFVLFLIELAVQSIGTPKVYLGSFFFWMDVVGLLSVPLDHSLISGLMPDNISNVVVMRAARTARLGARAGRFTKLVKMLRFLPGVRQEVSDGARGTAKTMSNALMTSLSTRVSCLIIVMVMVLPLFDMPTYPENDYSMKAWLNSLDLTLGRYGTSGFETRMSDFQSFYSDKDYYPYEVRYTTSNGTWYTYRLKGDKASRSSNNLEIKASSGLVAASFNFGSTKRVDALCNIILILVVIVLMMGFSLLLSNSVSVIVLNPLEELLKGVQRMASKIFKSVASMASKVKEGGDQDQDDSQDGDGMGNETDLLEKVIEKLAALSAITMRTSPIDAATLEQLGENDRLLLQTFSPGQILARRSDTSADSSADDSLDKREETTEELVSFLETRLDQAGLAWGLIDSWEFDALEVEEHQRQLACQCFVVFHLGVGYTAKQQAVLAAFIQAAAAGYGEPTRIPYHNWYHAVDVTHCVFRLLHICATERFFSNYERFALVTSAVCHDIGHPGSNNPFLVETAHELAIRYNDHSPLENMHCAKLFELVGRPQTAIFAALDRQQYREVRQVCIEAILHTDNIHHFPMVKELQMLYEMNSDVFDVALQMYQTAQLDFPPREICDVFAEPEKKKLLRNLFLHFSDISNPTKPFPICKKWAWNIIEEFFLQGDQEKALGITVQPLNDREKVNKAYSQVGFIEFFVAPFAFATVRLLPTLVPCTDQMMLNLNHWCEEWLVATTPPPEPEDIAKLQDRIAKLEAKFIFREGF